MQLAHTQSTAVLMPDTGYGRTGTLVHWHKQPGEPVERGEPLGLVEVDVADFELLAPSSGTLERLLAKAGQSVSVAEPVAAVAPVAEYPSGSQGGTNAQRQAHRADRRDPRHT